MNATETKNKTHEIVFYGRIKLACMGYAAAPSEMSRREVIKTLRGLGLVWVHWKGWLPQS